MSFFYIWKSAHVCVCVCDSESASEKKWEGLHAWEAHGGESESAKGEKRNQPLIRWSQLITFSRPDGRHSYNLWPQPSGPSVFRCSRVPLEVNNPESMPQKQVGVRGWDWSLNPVRGQQTENLHQNFRETPWGSWLPGFLTFSHGHQKGGKKIPCGFCLFRWMWKTQHLRLKELNIGFICCSKYSLGMQSAWVYLCEAVIPTGSKPLLVSRLAPERAGSGKTWHGRNKSDS